MSKGFVLVGGLSGLMDRLDVPRSTRQSRTTVRIVVQFIVDELGCTRDYTLVEGTDRELASAVVAAIQRSAFLPAERDGTPVPIRGQLPISVR